MSRREQGGWVRGPVVALLAILVTAACTPIGVGTTTPSAAATRAPIPVRAAWVAISGSQSPAWVAQDGGHFARNGLAVDLSFIEGSSRATAAMLGGSVDILVMAGPAAVTAARQGGDVVMVAGCLNTSVFRLMADPSIKTMADLRGKTVAITSLGTSDEFLLKKLLSSNGLAANTDVQIVQARDAAGQVAILRAGQVQAALLSPPNDLIARKGGAIVLADTVPMKLAYQATGVATTRAYLRSHRPEVLAFVRSMAEAIRRIKTDRAFAESIMGKYLKTDDSEVLEASWSAYSAAFDDIPYPSLAGIRQILDESGASDRDPADFADMSVVKELEDSGAFR